MISERITSTFTLIFLTMSLWAQNFNKMNFHLADKSLKREWQDKTITVFIKGDSPQIEKDVIHSGGTVLYSAGDISVLKVSYGTLPFLSSKGYVQRIEAHIPHFKLMSDSMRIKANVNPVYYGQAPLPQGYDGTGVVMGVIDTGIDYSNPDFKDSLTGKTRVKFLWDQTYHKSSNTPLKYGYGQEWNNFQIDAGKAETTNNGGLNHGTSTCGISAGNGNYSPGRKYRGVAPKADLVVVALNFDTTLTSVITDAVDYIYGKADSMGEPCVINLSLGDYYGSHDGLDLQAQLMNNMLTAKNGRAMVASAGNGGSLYFHLGYTLTGDTNFTWFNFTSNPSYNDSVIEIWADTLNFKNAGMAIGADINSGNFNFRGKTKFITVADNKGIMRNDTLFNPSGNRIAVIESNTSLQGGSYDIVFKIIPDSSIGNYNWRLMLTGQGKFDLWNFELVSSGLPAASNFPAIANYKMPDTLQTMLSSFQCLDNVIVVGNYDNKKTYIDFNGNRQEPFASILPGGIDRSSSIGPTRDGRLKPDIAAPGAMTMASADLREVSYLDTAVPTFVEINGYIRAGGTSASSPVVAGVAALYLERYPAASFREVKTAITACPMVDSFTGIVPNTTWGYGKVDAFATLTNCVTGINPILTGSNSVSVYPNPFCESATISYDLSNFTNNITAEFAIYDVLGNLVRKIVLTEKAAKLTLEKENLESGCYFYKLLLDGQALQSGKLLVL